MKNGLDLSGRFLSVAIADTSRDGLDQAVQRIFGRIAPGRLHRTVRGLRLADIYKIDPPPGAAHFFKVAVFSPRHLSGKSALITNVADGWNSLCHLVASEHQRFQIQVISTTDNADYPQHRIEVWRNGRSTRVVMAMRDTDQWIFVEKGEPEDFEETKLYERRLIKNRLDRGIVVRYLQRIGWDVTQLSFWESESEAIYFEELRKR